MIDPIDDARALHQHAADLRDVQARLGDLLGEAGQTLIVLQRFLPADVSDRLSSRLTRLKELRNSMELGSFSFEIDKAAEVASHEIMNPKLPPARGLTKPVVKRKSRASKPKSLVESFIRKGTNE